MSFANGVKDTPQNTAPHIDEAAVSSVDSAAQTPVDVRGPGLVQVYTGDGKGKTTAALGLALRAAGHGYKVFIFQFLKGGQYTGELKSINMVLHPLIKIEQFGTGCIKTSKQVKISAYNGKSGLCPRNYTAERDVLNCGACRYCFLIHDEDYVRTRKAIKMFREFAASGSYDIIILDELTHAINKGLVSAEEVVDIIKSRKKGVEIVITGRDAPPELLEIADLVTEMHEVKHPWKKGVPARKGIEY